MASSIVRTACIAIRQQSFLGIRSSSTAHVKDMGGAFKERESAAENAYFNKEEQIKMEALVKKLRRQIEPTEAEQNADKKALKAIFTQNDVIATEKVLNDLMKWRFGK